MRAFLARPSTLTAAALAAGALMFAFVAYRWADDHARALAKYRQEVEMQTGEAAEAASYKLSLVYQGLRTIARLPSVRTIDRHATSLDADDKRSIQELYNNLAASVDMSEVYVTSADFNPDRIDPKTRKLEEPIIMFDELIVGKHAEQAQGLRGAAGDGPDTYVADTPRAEEIEIHEYRQLRRQIAEISEKFPAADSFDDLNYPAISSPPVVTCDNRFFKPSDPKDADRTGIIYSVPFYGPNGRFRGVVSGIVLTRNIHALLGPGRYRLANAAIGYLSEPTAGLPAASERLFQVQHTLGVPEVRGQWIVAGFGVRSQFAARDDVDAANRIAFQGFGLAAVLTLAFLLAARVHRRFAMRAYSREANLDAMIRTRTTELNAKLNELEAQRAALEAARAEAIQASEAKSQFLANMSHELRTPLNAIIGFSDLMQQEIRGPLGHPSYRGYAADIRNSGSHLLSLINDILDLSKIEAGRFELHQSTFNLHDALQASFKLIAVRAAQSGVALHDQVSPHLLFHGDERAIQQIVLNLLTNAVKFTPAGGSVHVQSFLDAEWLTLKVIDTGKGIAPEDIARVFESFGQGRHDHAVKDRGTGLGLPIVKGLIESHGGDVRIDSLPGRGTTVVARFPASRLRLATAAA